MAILIAYKFSGNGLVLSMGETGIIIDRLIVRQSLKIYAKISSIHS